MVLVNTTHKRTVSYIFHPFYSYIRYILVFLQLEDQFLHPLRMTLAYQKPPFSDKNGNSFYTFTKYQFLHICDSNIPYKSAFDLYKSDKKSSFEQFFIRWKRRFSFFFLSPIVFSKALELQLNVGRTPWKIIKRESSFFTRERSFVNRFGSFFVEILGFWKMNGCSSE